MPSFSSDTIVPLGVAAVCALGLAAASQLEPQPSTRGLSQNATGKIATAAAGATGDARSRATTHTPPRAPRTLPHIEWRPQPDAGAELTRLAFGSCLNQSKPQPIWQAVVAAKPQIFLMLGDNVYGDFNEPSGDKLVKAYAALSAQPEFASARAAMPFLATWDDHDYGKNDGGAEFAHKAVATRLFEEFWAGSGTLQGDRGPGVSYARVFGPPGRRAQLIFLDTRSFRSALTRKPKGAPGKGRYAPDPDADKTVLGDAQWQWLEARLAEPADVRFIASSIQVLADGHGWERWGNLPAERARLFTLLEKTAARGVIFLSGDRHRAAFYRMSRPDRAALVEATSSALNYSFPDATENGPYQLAPTYGRDNFGMATIDWESRTVTLSLRSMDGIAVEAVAVPIGPRP